MPAPRAARARRAAPLRVVAVAVGAGLLLAACGSGGSGGEPAWTPKPSFSGEGYDPTQQQSAPAAAPPSGSPSASPSPSRSGTGDPAVVATKLRAPTGIVIMSDNTALVGERTTGRIVRVQPVAGKAVQTVRTLTGLSTAGGGGLLDLALSPNYGEDQLIFAYITTPTDNRVVDFTLHGPVTTVLKGIPRGASDNTGRIVFAPDGSLLVGTGDAGRPALAKNPHSLAGKVLRISDIGRPVSGNAVPGSRVYASGLRRTDGLCVDPTTSATFQVEDRGGAASDPVNQIVKGASYGWPSTTAASTQPLVLLPTTSSSPGGCAVLDHVLYTTSLAGRALLAAKIAGGSARVSATLGQFAVSLRNKYGRLRTVVAAPDGALWLTTSNRDGRGQPVPDDERVIRIVPGGGAGSTNPL